MLIKIKAILKLMRWFHEVAVIIPFITLYFVINYFIKENAVSCQLSASDFTLLCICVQALIAAGCVLNDIADRDIDKINKPLTYIIGNTVSLFEARLLFIILTLFILVLSAYISISVFKEWAYISAGVYVLSILYDLKLKRSPLLGNILVAILTSFIPLVLFFFASGCIDALQNPRIAVLIWLFAGFAFLVITARELSLDISDLEGDRACGAKTLPAIIGADKSKNIVIAMLLFTILSLAWVAVTWNYLAISATLVDLLLLYYIYCLRSVQTRIEYIRIGRFLWFILLFGLVAFTVSTVF